MGKMKKIHLLWLIANMSFIFTFEISSYLNVYSLENKAYHFIDMCVYVCRGRSVMLTFFQCQTTWQLNKQFGNTSRGVLLVWTDRHTRRQRHPHLTTSWIINIIKTTKNACLLLLFAFCVVSFLIIFILNKNFDYIYESAGVSVRTEGVED